MVRLGLFLAGFFSSFDVGTGDSDLVLAFCGRPRKSCTLWFSHLILWMSQGLIFLLSLITDPLIIFESLKTLNLTQQWPPEIKVIFHQSDFHKKQAALAWCLILMTIMAIPDRFQVMSGPLSISFRFQHPTQSNIWSLGFAWSFEDSRGNKPARCEWAAWENERIRKLQRNPSHHNSFWSRRLYIYIFFKGLSTFFEGVSMSRETNRLTGMNRICVVLLY